MAEKITLHEMTPHELKDMLQDMMKEEFDIITNKLQTMVGEDDLISSGRACRMLGMSYKTLKILTDQGTFSVYHHMKERRYNRGEIIEYRDRYLTKRKRG